MSAKPPSSKWPYTQASCQAFQNDDPQSGNPTLLPWHKNFSIFFSTNPLCQTFLSGVSGLLLLYKIEKASNAYKIRTKCMLQLHSARFQLF